LLQVADAAVGTQAEAAAVVVLAEFRIIQQNLLLVELIQ
jgi:hypothetical protein